MISVTNMSSGWWGRWWPEKGGGAVTAENAGWAAGWGGAAERGVSMEM